MKLTLSRPFCVPCAAAILCLAFITSYGNARLIGKPLADYWRLWDEGSSTSSAPIDNGRKWPFDDTKRCSKLRTRDVEYKEQDSKSLPFSSLPFCGLNRFSKSEKSDWLRDYREYLGGIYPLYDRKTSSPGTTNRRERDEKTGGDTDTQKERRIVGGRAMETGEWPWLAAIGTKALGPRCGGTLVGDRWVLSAAHCFKDEEDPCAYNIRLGSINWMRDGSGNSVDISPDAIFRHPYFDERSSINDVALLRLPSRMKLQRNGPINAICLPDKEQSVTPGTVCTAAGWGLQMVKKAASLMVEEAQEVDLPVLGFRDKCGLYKNGTMKPGMICAGYLEGGRDTCQGDSGGPIVFERDGRWFQLGITSFGDGCARPGYPGIYTDVGRFIHWIASVVDRYS